MEQLKFNSAIDGSVDSETTCSATTMTETPPKPTYAPPKPAVGADDKNTAADNSEAQNPKVRNPEASAHKEPAEKLAQKDGDANVSAEENCAVE
ncbi:unnamed protein product [Echinostoma caproni]|uniref:Fibrous sheath CABYR-binding protein-like n=1 Tax=Echinostoma caproni TaxID=27848 RepID=A0A183A878_9TREM|nr:unnamed protein product [Echinostoma caproni]